MNVFTCIPHKYKRIPWEKVKMFYEYNQVPDKISGVYRIIFPNDKNYIGISNNIRRRMMEHFGADINKKPELPISRALLKYGITNIKIEIIEKIDSYNRFFMREREKYWIKYYNSLIHLNGYNVSCGGDGADVGENNHEALLSASQLCEIIKDLKESTLTIKEIADKYNVNDYVISRINNGHTYFNKENSYPIRKRHVKKQGLENKNSKFYNNLELFENIRTDLLYSTLSAKEITEKYSISPSLLHNINYGKIGYKIKGQLLSLIHI